MSLLESPKSHNWGGLNNRNVLSQTHSSGGKKSEVKVSARLGPSEGGEGRICPLSLACR